jgi:hypothetical protein
MKKKTKETVGQKLLAVVISEQLGISMHRAMKSYVVASSELHPSWETLGEDLLRQSIGRIQPTSALALPRKTISLRSRRRRLSGRNFGLSA